MPHCSPNAPTNTSRFKAVFTRPDSATGNAALSCEYAILLRLKLTPSSGHSHNAGASCSKMASSASSASSARPMPALSSSMGEMPWRASHSEQVATNKKPISIANPNASKTCAACPRPDQRAPKRSSSRPGGS